MQCLCICKFEKSNWGLISDKIDSQLLCKLLFTFPFGSETYSIKLFQNGKNDPIQFPSIKSNFDKILAKSKRTLSKVFNTIEGGALTYNNDEYKKKLNYLKNFGMKYFPSEEYTVNELKKNMDRALLIKINIEHISGKLVHEK